MYLLGFSINLLTLFGLVLAIGIVVDDAIAVIAIVLMLCAVFIPVSFLGGLAGELYCQFAVTIAVSVAISGIVALTLPPALAALLLREHKEPVGLFRAFNRGFSWLTDRYESVVSFFLSRVILSIVAVLLMVGATWFLFRSVPSSIGAARGPRLCADGNAVAVCGLAKPHQRSATDNS